MLYGRPEQRGGAGHVAARQRLAHRRAGHAQAVHLVAVHARHVEAEVGCRRESSMA
jgi:hypothetical protein